MDDCIFCRIARGELPSRKLYEDEDVLAFYDIHPIAPVHFMIIPKLHLASLDQCGAEHTALLGKILGLAPRLAREAGSSEGFRTIINTGRIGRQDVFHLHMHVLGGPNPLSGMLARSTS
ncbi:MAG: histidine triad nucleotide-binding protein [Betaproteobacteria bacterium]|nr:histidine triad nucleotide-binding protein [Betaproteobacteria bacterium]